jgi:hypothetical protein
MNKPTKTPAQMRASLEAIRAAALGKLPARFAHMRDVLASGLRS